MTRRFLFFTEVVRGLLWSFAGLAVVPVARRGHVNSLPKNAQWKGALWFGATLLLLAPLFANAQMAYFADGFHGGVYGHYPSNYTQFIVDSLVKHPSWKINLEIEPETWDSAQYRTPEAYAALQRYAADQSANGRVEFVNPAYGQSYLWNISGESVIQQLRYGMRKIREHFPGETFVTYSSEEPCFTSALPEILTSFGFKYAVLKNPNTCWGGYAAAHGGELVDWIGADGTAIRAVPRYEVEALSSRSTWETIAAANSPAYIEAALHDGILHPVGMCFQDAGWRFGPWLSHFNSVYPTNEYVTWREYFENVSKDDAAPAWHFSQEDVHVSLVWGSLILQRIAQEVRRAENRLVTAEKMAAMAEVWRQMPWPQAELDGAWRQLLLSQHHDCWIVPYNNHAGHTWADAVADWTGNACRVSDEVISHAAGSVSSLPKPEEGAYVRAYNTTAAARTDMVSFAIPGSSDHVKVLDEAGEEVPSQIVMSNNIRYALFSARTPPIGFATYHIAAGMAKEPVEGAIVSQQADGTICMETDAYKLILAPAQGGTIKSLVAKKIGRRELIDGNNPRCANEIRGYFYADKKFYSTADNEAQCDIVESGPLRVAVEIHSLLESNRVTQRITLTQGQPRIDCSVHIEWEGSPGIGNDYKQSGGYDAVQDQKAFYDTRAKLLVLFPLALREQQVFKNAPFDVMESKLDDTFFNKWSEIKNDIILNWVDVFDRKDGLGIALLSDHTTSYAHGSNFPLALTLQYSGVGLWGRNYSIKGPTDVSYALLPHAGNWSEAKLSKLSDQWNEPLFCQTCEQPANKAAWGKSLMSIDNDAISISSIRVEDGSVVARLFNGSDTAAECAVRYFAKAKEIDRVELDGRLVEHLALRAEKQAGVVHLKLPRLGIATIRMVP